MVPAEDYSLTHAKTAHRGRRLGERRPPHRGRRSWRSGPNVKPFEQPPALIDMAPTILAALDAPAAIKHTGRVLHEIVGADAHMTAREAEPTPSIPGMPIPGMGDESRHRHRGRRDGGAPPRPRLPRVAAT